MPILLLAVTLVSCVLALATDLLVGALLSAPVTIVAHVLKFSVSNNPGIAFSIRIPSPWQELIILAALATVAVLAVKSKLNRLSAVAFGIIFGGAIANLIDRFMDGTVTDFIAVGSFPVFNVADSCITVGVVLLFVDGCLHHRKTAAASH